ncbi:MULTISPECIES: ParB/RepB/Spo0J family partition protein [Pseudomonas]|uniref:ParB/RepB/Spo0J family partition protein n=1 Tax=Pseudomonas juntendi TaxID=2666183 RepID=A0A7W2LQN4_9PSED|nr:MULTISPECIES: ParB/RepB/Spo0J family partition protein [Pseudomonas]MBA6145283.1 ParB/RepB/Spo0J family partition protein [Pseudomonas juntendi]MCZ9641104.1 ParB/RepB/Spo0J family partition protein [Pseudomonas putida]
MAKKLDLTDLANFDPTPAAAPATSGASAGPVQVPTGDVIPDPKQPRKKFDQDKLEKLAKTIKASRLNQPVTVRPKNADGKYVIVMGERRWRACTLAGLETIPVIFGDKADGYDQVTENTEQEPLTTMELARFIAEKIQEGDKRSYIAERLGMRADAVSQHLALATAPDFIQQLGDDTQIGGRTLYELIQAHKEYPAEVERFAQQPAEEITRASLGRLVEQLRTREALQAEADAQAKAQAESKAQQSDNAPGGGQNTGPANQKETTGPKPDGDGHLERPLDLPPPVQTTPATPEPKVQDSGQPWPVVKILVEGRAASLTPTGTVQVVYADTGEIGEVDLSTVQILSVEERRNESS